MNKVISSYFDEAHRSLQSNRESTGFTGAQHLQLPPLRSSSPPSDSIGEQQGTSSAVVMRQSASMSMLDVQDKAARGVTDEKLSQVSQENARLKRKLRTMQDQFAVTSAKKEAFKQQAFRLERDFKKGHEASESLQRDLLDARREAEQSAMEAREAVSMMAEMRKSHIQEVRLLQRGLAARGGDEKLRNRVNEVADLVDKLGRAVVQRDEAVRDKTKAQTQLTEATADVRTLSEEMAKLKKQNASLQERLKAALRKVKLIEAQPDQEAMNVDDSDEEFEVELHLVERRIEIMKDNAAGADILASNLDKEKEQLRQKVNQEEETIQMLERSVEYWIKTTGERDEQIVELNNRLETVLKHQAAVEQQIIKKKNAIAEDVDEERSRLEKRVAELEAERDAAQAAVQGMQKASDRLTQELVHVHDMYADNWERKKEEQRQIAEAKAIMGDEVDDEDEEDEDEEEEAVPVEGTGGTRQDRDLEVSATEQPEPSQAEGEVAASSSEPPRPADEAAVEQEAPADTPVEAAAPTEEAPADRPATATETSGEPLAEAQGREPVGEEQAARPASSGQAAASAAAPEEASAAPPEEASAAAPEAPAGAEETPAPVAGEADAAAATAAAAAEEVAEGSAATGPEAGGSRPETAPQLIEVPAADAVGPPAQDSMPKAETEEAAAEPHDARGAGEPA